jgi:hypothetical protein
MVKRLFRATEARALTTILVAFIIKQTVAFSHFFSLSRSRSLTFTPTGSTTNLSETIGMAVTSALALSMEYGARHSIRAPAIGEPRAEAASRVLTSKPSGRPLVGSGDEEVEGEGVFGRGGAVELKKGMKTPGIESSTLDVCRRRGVRTRHTDEAACARPAWKPIGAEAGEGEEVIIPRFGPRRPLPKGESSP